MNDPRLNYLHQSLNMLHQSIATPAVAALVDDSPKSLTADLLCGQPYDSDDHREFHVPVTQVQTSFYTVMAKSAADAEAIVNDRMRRDRSDEESLCRCQIGPAIEA